MAAAIAASGATALCLVATTEAAPVSVPAPSARTPISLKYSGTFDMTNKLVPQSIPSSYTHHVE